MPLQHTRRTVILFCAIIVILFATAAFEMQALRASTARLGAMQHAAMPAAQKK
ncbi:hypothetical protein HY285_04580 [Candidatus Peregrinibacteria bacterium]|nr:hypothetical protein [Candidatus Peregrinibacteria bacterium]